MRTERARDIGVYSSLLVSTVLHGGLLLQVLRYIWHQSSSAEPPSLSFPITLSVSLPQRN